MWVTTMMFCAHCEKEKSIIYSSTDFIHGSRLSTMGEVHINRKRWWREVLEFWFSLLLLPLQSLPFSLLSGQAAQKLLYLPLSLCVTETHNVQKVRPLNLNISVHLHMDTVFDPHLLMISLSFSLARKRESFLISLRAPLNSFLYLCFSRSFSLSSLVLPCFFP